MPVNEIYSFQEPEPLPVLRSCLCYISDWAYKQAMGPLAQPFLDNLSLSEPPFQTF